MAPRRAACGFIATGPAISKSSSSSRVWKPVTQLLKRIPVSCRQLQLESVTRQPQAHRNTPTLDTGATEDRQELTFAYREEYNLLVCLHCKCALGISFANHAQKQHRISIPQEDEKKIKAMCFVEESLYFKCDQTLLPPLDFFLPVLDGFRCGTCNYYGTVLRRITKHAREVHRNNQAVPCKLQTISTSNCVRYFCFAKTSSRTPALSRGVVKVC